MAEPTVPQMTLPWPLLIDGQHIVFYDELRKLDEKHAARLWARAVAEGTTLAIQGRDAFRYGWLSQKNQPTNGS